MKSTESALFLLDTESPGMTIGGVRKKGLVITYPASLTFSSTTYEVPAEFSADTNKYEIEKINDIMTLQALAMLRYYFTSLGSTSSTLFSESVDIAELELMLTLSASIQIDSSDFGSSLSSGLEISVSS